MNPLHQLESRFDGTLPAADRARALRRTLADAADRRRRTHCRIGKVTPTRAGTIDAMAAALIVARSVRGAAGEADLARQGFSPAEIANHGQAAVRRAAALWNRRAEAAS